MGKKQTFLGGVFLLTAAMFICKFVAFINNIVLVNIKDFGNMGMGIYYASFEIYLVVLAISTMGIPSAIAKMVSEKIALGDRRGAHKIFKTSFFFLMLVGSAATILLIVFAKAIAAAVKVDAAYSVIALAPTVFFASLMAVYRGYFQGMQDMRPQAISQVIEQFFKLVFSIALVFPFLKYGLSISAAGATFGTTAGAVLGTVYLWMLYNKKKRTLWKEIRESSVAAEEETPRTIIRNLVMLSVPISAGSIIATMSSVIDLTTIMHRLSAAGFSNEQALDLFGQLGKVQQLVNFPVALNISIATAVVPAIASARIINDYKTVKNRILTALRLTVIFGVPSAIGMSVLAKPVIHLLFPNAGGGEEILMVLAYTVIFMAVSQSLTGVLQGLNRIYIPALALLAGAAAKFAVNFIFVAIPSINIVGAAYGSIACYLVSSAINILAVKKVLKLNFDTANTVIKPVLAAVIMGLATYFVYNGAIFVSGSVIFSIIISVIVSILIYMAVLIFTGAIGYADFKMIPMGDKLGSLLQKAKLLQDKEGEQA